jgi:mannitol-1-/sugar-/sorbitol-6-phosphatase
MPRSLGDLDGRDFAAVLFDMDGTLIDSTPAVVRSWVRWAQEEDVDPLRLAHSHGIPARGIIEGLLPTDRIDAAVARIEEIEMGDTDGIAVLPGAAAALAALQGGHSAIVTSCTRPLAAARIDATGLVAPALVVTASDVERGKPHPDPFLRAAQRLSVDPADCLVVEDAPGGLTAARAAGCATLAVTTTTPRQDLVADAVVDTLADVRFRVEGGRVLVTSQVTDP